MSEICASRLLLAGTARADITPHGPVSMGGYGQRAGKVSIGVHDPLFAKALFLTNGSEKLLFITTDLVELPNSVVKRVLQGLAAAKVAPEAGICLTASHTHSGPNVDESLIIAAPNREYIHSLFNTLIRLGCDAAADPVTVKIKMAAGKVNFMVNRRQQGTQNLVDERVLAAEFLRETDNHSLAVLFGIGCHAVCLGHDNLLISADYPGFAQRVVEEELGTGCALFINLTEGNVIPSTRPLYDSLDTRGYLGGSFADAEKIGKQLGKEVGRILKETRPEPLRHLRASKRDLKVRPTHAEMSLLAAYKELLRQRKVILEYLPDFRKASIFNLKPVLTLWRDASELVIARDMDEVEMRRLMSAVSTFLMMAMKLSNPMLRTGVPVSVQTIEINDYRIITLPGEVLVEVGRDWQTRNSPEEEKAFVFGLANGFMGYLPHPCNFAEEGAAFKYETIMNGLEQDAARIFLYQAEQMVRE